ncbi:hypothetical protein GCM10023084_59140 [Streptomyces lacrimifluminis]|uniref:Uncharacterized protein n=1 Tax=Streptomyces lacrimifluminis TaxID=1500077 RepID=A0A917LDD1_9ACTN|nr:hypothetical protein [Streptomyces lacrimifluminis]GGJ56590.1 hypothetical protein GCM10012282_62090 [Streptomyces lacrimifluminis]
MNLPQAVTETIAPYRTLVVEGHEGVHRTQLLSELALLGFPLRRPPGRLQHLDPARPYRDLLAEPGRLVIDGGIIGELVYGPLRHGRSRVTWIQALDFAEAVAEREGAMLHLTGGEHGVGHGSEPSDDGAAASAAALAYARVFRTLAQHVPVVCVNVTSATTEVATDRTHPCTRAPAVPTPGIEPAVDDRLVKSVRGKSGEHR